MEANLPETTAQARGFTNRIQPPARMEQGNFPGGDPIENEWLAGNLPLVRTMVGRAAINLPAEADLRALYRAALAGLAKAARHYDPGTGSAWETYARSLIRRAIFDHLRLLDYAGAGAVDPLGAPAYPQIKTGHFCQATTAAA